jgi:hypothetical protein
MISKSIFFLIFPFITCLEQDINLKYNDTLAILDKELAKCINDNKGKEVDCHKEYFHFLQDMVLDVHIAVDQIDGKNNTDSMTKEHVLWKDSSYWYYSKTHKEFKTKHPHESVLQPTLNAKADAILMLKKNATYVKQRIIYLLSLVKK